MDTPQVQNWTQGARPNSGVFQTFEDVPLTPLHNSDTSSGFSHSPLEHEIVASESIWDEPGTSDELIEQQIVFSPVRLGRSSPAVRTSPTKEHSSLNKISDQVHVDMEVSQEIGTEEAVPTSAVLGSCSDIAGVSRLGFASAETLVETRVALDVTRGPTVVFRKDSFSAELWRSPDESRFIAESDIGDEQSKSWQNSNKSKNPLNLTISTVSARVLAYSKLPRAVKSTTPASIPESFDIPIPIFPFPAGTSRCKDRDCPIKTPHEQGPYLHEGKLRTREGSIFGSSNPPPEIWFLYDRSGNGDLPGIDDKPFAPVELFVRYHFGETRSECVTGPDEGREQDVEQGANLGGKNSRSWRFWSGGKLI